MSSNFMECQYYTNLKGPYFRIAWRQSHTVGRAGSPTCTVRVCVTLTGSKINVKAWRSKLMV